MLRAGSLLTIPEPIPAKFINVYDGDTLTVEIRHTANRAVPLPVRLLSIDTPEFRGQYIAEQHRARLAHNALIAHVGQMVILTDIQAGKYYPRRILARVHTVTGQDLGQLLLRFGHGRSYHRDSASWLLCS